MSSKHHAILVVAVAIGLLLFALDGEFVRLAIDFVVALVVLGLVGAVVGFVQDEFSSRQHGKQVCAQQDARRAQLEVSRRAPKAARRAAKAQ